MLISRLKRSKLLTPAAWETRVPKYASVASSSHNISQTRTLASKLLTERGFRTQKITSALQRFFVETNRQRKDVLPALSSGFDWVDVELIFAAVL